MPRTQVSVVAAFVTVGVALLGAEALYPRTPRFESDPDPRFVGDEDLRHRGAELDARIGAAVSRLYEKRSVTLALIRGELKLQQAVDRFRGIIGADTAFFDYLRRSRPGATDSELLYRNVVGFARNVLGEWPDLHLGVLDRLEAELIAMFPARQRKSDGAVGRAGRQEGLRCMTTVARPTSCCGY